MLQDRSAGGSVGEAGVSAGVAGSLAKLLALRSPAAARWEAVRLFKITIRLCTALRCAP